MSKEYGDADIEAGKKRWAEQYAAAEASGQVRDADFTTLSGAEVDPVYGPRPGETVEEFGRIGWPGQYPYTRGIHATGYRGKQWTIRQFAGKMIEPRVSLSRSTAIAVSSFPDQNRLAPLRFLGR